MTNHADLDNSAVSQPGVAHSGPTSSDVGITGVEAAWVEVAAQLRRAIGARTFDQWVKHVRPLSLDTASGLVTLSAPSAFTAEQIASRFAERIALIWKLQDARVTAVAVVPVQPMVADVDSITPLAAPRVPRLSIDAKFSFANFVQGKCNILALNAARRVAAVEPPQFHPLFLHGETGQGKTHLLHAIASTTLAHNPHAHVILMSAEKFMLEFIAAMRANDMLAFKARLRSADVLAIDDLQFVIGKDSTQVELLHTMDEVIAAGGRLVVSADRLPHRLDGIDQRLLSRLAGGLIADIDPPELELRLTILERKALSLGVEVPRDVIEWIAQQFPRNVRELEGALNKLVAYASLSDMPIDLNTAQTKLSEVARGSRARVTIEDIQRAVCAHYRIDKSEMASQRRVRSLARPRQIAMYLAKELTPRSFPEIGRRFGGRDHSTVIHAVRTIATLRQQDADMDADIQRIRRALTA